MKTGLVYKYMTSVAKGMSFRTHMLREGFSIHNIPFNIDVPQQIRSLIAYLLGEGEYFSINANIALYVNRVLGSIHDPDSIVGRLLEIRDIENNYIDFSGENEWSD